MSYSLDHWLDGCYDNSSVLINKFNIKDQYHLDQVEQSITSALIAKAAVEIPFENVDFDFYKNLHRYVFSDIYNWAGNIRTVNMSKKGTNFCDYKEIELNGNRIFCRLVNSFKKTTCSRFFKWIYRYFLWIKFFASFQRRQWTYPKIVSYYAPKKFR